MDTPILIFGSGKKARIALEIFQTNNIIVYGLLDEENSPQENTTYSHVSVLGDISDKTYHNLLGDQCHPFIAIEDCKKFKATLAQLAPAKKLFPINAIHPFTNLSKEAQIAAGNIINAGTTIGPQTHIHNYCTLMGHNRIAHDTTLHDHVYIGAGTIINENVTIHEQAHIESGVVIKENITIGARVHIPAGTVVTRDIESPK